MKTKLIINNEYLDAENYQDVIDPEDGQVLGQMALASTSNVDAAYVSAKAAFTSWRDLPAHERMYKLELVAHALLEKKNEIASLLCAEISKPMSDSIKEVERSAEYILFTANAFRTIEGRVAYGDRMPGMETVQKTAMIVHEPYGVALAISPFNYPINLAVTKIAPALVAGNTVVFKPSAAGSLSAYLMSEIFASILPAGVFNYISGKSSEIGDYLIKHKDVSMVAFTGSTEVGRHIQSIASVPVYLELGGKDAAIVLEDADLDHAVSEIIKGAFSYSAERCTAVKRIILQNSIADKFIGKLLEHVIELKVGSAKDDANITSLIDNKAVHYVMNLAQDAKDKGAKILAGFKADRNVVYPTVIDNVTSDMRIYSEEPFGPVIPIIRFNTIEESIQIVNESRYGLQADVFTQNINYAFNIANKLDTGTVQINGKSDRGPDNFPFPGIKDSGMGVAGLTDAILGMMRTKVIVINI